MPPKKKAPKEDPIPEPDPEPENLSDAPDPEETGQTEQEAFGTVGQLPSQMGGAQPFVGPGEADADVSKVKTPAQSGFIAEMIVGAGGSLRHTEAVLTGDPVAFAWTPWDEKIWRGVGQYVESELDPKKYGVMVLLLALIGNEVSHVAVYASHRGMLKPKPKIEAPVSKKAKAIEEGPAWKAGPGGRNE